MEEQIISFPTAKLAKEKQFDLNTFNGYDSNSVIQEYFTYQSYALGEPEINLATFKQKWEYQAPTQGLLQRWLREKHNINIVITSDFKDFGWALKDMTYEEIYKDHSDFWRYGYDSYEQALEAALFEALYLIKND